MKFEFEFPDVGEGIHEGVITKWLVKEGDEVSEGQSIVEVETDKVTTEIPSPRSGTILDLKANKGDTINVGSVFVTIQTGSATTDKDLDSKNDKVEEVESEIVEEETAGVVGEVVSSSMVIPPSDEIKKVVEVKSSTEKVLATPVARKLAKDLEIDINTIKGTGPNGRVMKDDIYKASESSLEDIKKPEEVKKVPLQIPDNENVERIKLTKIRKTISQKMSESRFTIPHTTAMDEVDITKLYEFRKKYKKILKDDINLTYLPFIVKATIVALKQFPEFNASLDEENDELVLKKYYNIGIATDTERGLMVPVVKNADKLSITDLAKAIEEISTKAKENKIELSQLKGGSFSITNYGSIGGYFGIPIINYPESGILGLGRVTKKPVVKDDEIVIAYVLPLSLSYDHRIIDGASGARFLNVLKELLSDPEMLLLKA